MKRPWLLGTLILLAACSARPAPLAERLKSGLSVGCRVTEDERSAGPYTNGSLNWSATVELTNTGREGLRFGDDMILMDANADGDYFGAYVVYHATGSSGGAWGEDYYDRAHNYVIANYSRYWPDGSMTGYSDGGTHHMGAPPQYKAPKSACNTLLAPGGKAQYSTPMIQGVWLKRGLSSRVLLVLPEIESTSSAPVRSRCRMIVTLQRSDKTKGAWSVRDKTIVPLTVDALAGLLARSQADTATRILALNWLADADKKAAAAPILRNIKQAKAGDDFVASVQLLSYYGISPDPEALQAITTVAAGESSWSQKAATRYLKDQTASTAPKTK
jgi:hypothetical protein